MNELHFGNNLDVLRAMPAESVDLIYLDPPFNSNANYNVLYGTKHGGASKAQSHAFEDTWTWGRDAQRALDETAARHFEAGALLDAFQKVFAGSDMMAYLAMMAVRLIEMRRVLRPTGSLYLHCDPTASHYLKIVLDAIFDPRNFRSEVIWRRGGSHNKLSRQYGPIHDVILFYGKSKNALFSPGVTPHSKEYIDGEFRFEDKRGKYRLNEIMGPEVRKGNSGKPWRDYDPTLRGRHWAIPESLKEMLPSDLRGIEVQKQLDYLLSVDLIVLSKTGRPKYKQYPTKGVPYQDIWAFQPGTKGALYDSNDRIDEDVKWLSNEAEKLGYPTQKPVGLLERIIRTSSKPDDVVLDPFCGCGTAIHAAERLGRRWIGIDVTYLAIHVIEQRLVKAFGPGIKGSYTLYGRPEDAEDARALAARDWLEFQKWAVFTLDGLPKDRPGADGGIDGIIRYHQLGKDRASRAIVSVKGGLNVGVDAIHKLKSVMKREEAEIGVLVCVNPPTGPMLREAASERETGPTNKRVPKIQIVTIEQLFDPVPVLLPGMVDPPEVLSGPTSLAKRGRKRIEGQTEMLFPIAGAAEAPKRKGNRSIRSVDIEVTRSAYTRKAK